MIRMFKGESEKGSGSGATPEDYTKLSNKPQINGVLLTGDKSSDDLGIGSITILSTTYVSNSYVNETNFNRITVRKCGHIVVVNGLLQLNTALPKSTSATVIGKIDNLGTIAGGVAYGQSVSGSNGGVLNIAIETDGRITLYNYQSANAPIGWYRFNTAIVVL